MDMAEQQHLAGTGPTGELRLDEPMRRHTSWRTGGPARRAYKPRDLKDLARFLRSLPAEEPVYPVGLGSNLLVRDAGVRGTLVLMHGALTQARLEQSAPLIYAEAGVASPKVARLATTHGLRGAEFLAGIPGTVGGALAMNAGCYGSETWDIVDSVLVVTRQGELKRRAPAEYEIGYRHVVLRKAEGTRHKARGARKSSNASPVDPLALAELFAAAWFRLTPGDGEEGRRVIKQLLQRRIASQPLEQPNAGSVFRNPPGDYAARLIESCGLKGTAIGGAMVSPKHANFIVNTGTASAADIEALIELVQRTVQARCGVMLEREVRIIGEKLESNRRGAEAQRNAEQ